MAGKGSWIYQLGNGAHSWQQLWCIRALLLVFSKCMTCVFVLTRLTSWNLASQFSKNKKREQHGDKLRKFGWGYVGCFLLPFFLILGSIMPFFYIFNNLSHWNFSLISYSFFDFCSIWPLFFSLLEKRPKKGKKANKQKLHTKEMVEMQPKNDHKRQEKWAARATYT